MSNIIFISGTPCTGKTTVSEILAGKLNWELVKINDLAISNNLVLGIDEDKGYKVIDIDALNELLLDIISKTDNLIVEGHLSHLCSGADKLIILRCRPEILKERLALRNYSDAKIHENLEAEALGVCSAESLDIYENNAYDIQQELKITYGNQLDLVVEIISICDREQLEKVFERNQPQVVLHAAAHKHVPLMEKNCTEAVKNNVFGTLNMVEVSEKFGVEKFIMISTDKAVNPTNVMGATKRMCEMIVQSRTNSKTKFSATRFGNVLGSNGSVIPLFRRQIANGGPITLTDKRIIRYFMTIPEASQLVLTSGAMAKNGELYVLDMGKPVKILELAENMIRLSGLEPYKDINIIETGLRPGEKLYEELLIKTEDLDKTENSMIFIERDAPHSTEDIQKKLNILRDALSTSDDGKVKEALKACVDTFHDPNEVNATAIQAEEMRLAEDKESVAV